MNDMPAQKQVESISCWHYPQEGPCNCGYKVFLLSRYISETESRGERCYALEGCDIFKHDSWNFDLSISDSVKWEYNYLLGDENGSSLFLRKNTEAQDLRQQVGTSASISDIEWLLTRNTISVVDLRQYLKDLSFPHKGDHAASLNALEFATELYGSLNGCTINIETIRHPLYAAAWVSFLTLPLSDPSNKQKPQDMLPDSWSPIPYVQGLMGTPVDMSGYTAVDSPVDTELYTLAYEMPDQTSTDTERLRLAMPFACIAMFETGEFNIDPKSLEGVMALSIGDSIYVATALLSDPSDSQDRCPVRRVMGNLGRSEMAFLVPPSSPRLVEYDLTSWNLVNHLPFDGAFEDNFSATSLHLSFTDFELPLDVGVRGLRDTLVVILESLVSVNDGGKHLGDIDILSLFSSQYVVFIGSCSHTTTTHSDSTVQNLISIDCWAEFLDLPKATGIVRAHGNWQARLAIAAASSQRKKRTLILPRNPCVRCLSDRTDLRSFDVIIA